MSVSYTEMVCILKGFYLHCHCPSECETNGELSFFEFRALCTKTGVDRACNAISFVLMHTEEIEDKEKKGQND